MIDLGRETDGNNEICLGVRFALCIIKSSTTRSYWAMFLGRWSPFLIILCIIRLWNSVLPTIFHGVFSESGIAFQRNENKFGFLELSTECYSDHGQTLTKSIQIEWSWRFLDVSKFFSIVTVVLLSIWNGVEVGSVYETLTLSDLYRFCHDQGLSVIWDALVGWNSIYSVTMRVHT